MRNQKHLKKGLEKKKRFQDVVEKTFLGMRKHYANEFLTKRIEAERFREISENVYNERLDIGAFIFTRTFKWPEINFRGDSGVFYIQKGEAEKLLTVLNRYDSPAHINNLNINEDGVIRFLVSDCGGLEEWSYGPGFYSPQTRMIRRGDSSKKYEKYGWPG